MYIVRDVLTHSVLYYEDNLPVITEDGLVHPYRASDIKGESHEILSVDEIPFRFLPGLVKYNDDTTWEITNQAVYNDIISTITPKPYIPESISDRQFFQILAINGLITEQEALAAVKTGDMPLAIESFIGNLPAEAQFNARMLLEGATSFNRSHPLTDAFGSMYGMTPEQIDQLWIAASEL